MHVMILGLSQGITQPTTSLSISSMDEALGRRPLFFNGIVHNWKTYLLLRLKNYYVWTKIDHALHTFWDKSQVWKLQARWHWSAWILGELLELVDWFETMSVFEYLSYKPWLNWNFNFSWLLCNEFVASSAIFLQNCRSLKLELIDSEEDKTVPFLLI